ncbi:MAG: hypothetical protein ACOCUS_06095 [Polyangiales bacterium]
MASGSAGVLYASALELGRLLAAEGLQTNAKPVWGSYGTGLDHYSVVVRVPPHWSRPDVREVVGEVILSTDLPGLESYGFVWDSNVCEVNVYAHRCRRTFNGARCCLPANHLEGACRFRCADRGCPGREQPASVQPHGECLS